LCGCGCSEFHAEALGKQSRCVPAVAFMAVTGIASSLATRFNLSFKYSPEELAEFSFQG